MTLCCSTERVELDCAKFYDSSIEALEKSGIFHHLMGVTTEFTGHDGEGNKFMRSIDFTDELGNSITISSQQCAKKEEINSSCADTTGFARLVKLSSLSSNPIVSGHELVKYVQITMQNSNIRSINSRLDHGEFIEFRLINGCSLLYKPDGAAVSDKFEFLFRSEAKIRENWFLYSLEIRSNGKMIGLTILNIQIQIEVFFHLGGMNYGARSYCAAIARWSAADPLSHEYYALSSYSYVANTPINAIDPDGGRIFFVGGANNSDGWEYINRWGQAFSELGVSRFTRINASTGKYGDMLFTSNFRSGTYTKKPVPMGHTMGTPIEHRSITEAYEQITTSLEENPLAEGEQLNLAGYSFGSVLQAQVALKLANKCKFVDNLVLIGSPIQDNSSFYQALLDNDNIGNVIRYDIEDDLLSNPSDVWEYVMGANQNSTDDGPHFDLARPGQEADRMMRVVMEWLRQQGVK